MSLYHVELNITSFRGKVVRQNKLEQGSADWLVLDVSAEELEQLRSAFDLVDEEDAEDSS